MNPEITTAFFRNLGFLRQNSKMPTLQSRSFLSTNRPLIVSKPVHLVEHKPCSRCLVVLQIFTQLFDAYSELQLARIPQSISHVSIAVCLHSSESLFIFHRDRPPTQSLSHLARWPVFDQSFRRSTVKEKNAHRSS